MLRDLYTDFLFIVLGIWDDIRSRHSFYKYLGKFWYVRAGYWPNNLALGADFEFHNTSEFDLSVDIGPFTFAAGRDWAIEL